MEVVSDRLRPGSEGRSGAVPGRARGLGVGGWGRRKVLVGGGRGSGGRPGRPWGRPAAGAVGAAVVMWQRQPLPPGQPAGAAESAGTSGSAPPRPSRVQV